VADKTTSESPAFLGKAACDLAILRGFIIAPIAGILAILVPAISERARQFYEERWVRCLTDGLNDADDYSIRSPKACVG